MQVLKSGDGGATKVRGRDYRAWVTRHLPVCAGGREGTPSRVIGEVPSPELSAEIGRARYDGITEPVVGFLPDEVPQRWMPEREDFAWLLERFRFQPYLLPKVPVGEKPVHVLCIADTSGSASRTSDPGTLAWACGQALGLPGVEHDAHSTGDEILAVAIASAALVVNAVNDWSLGFAIDVAAADAGRRVVRLGHPGYSPFRHVLLGQATGSSEDRSVPRIRAGVAHVLSGAGTDRPAPESRSWFAAADSLDRWRRLMGPEPLRRFWGGDGWREPLRISGDAADGWLHRPLAWSAAAAAMEEASFPPDARDRLVATLTRWLVEEQSRGIGGWVREAALGRWVRLQPGWIRAYRTRAGGYPEAGRAIVRWVIGGAESLPATAPEPGLLAAAIKELGNDSGEGRGLKLALAWREDWTALPALLPSGCKVAARMRSFCVEQCWRRLHAAGLARGPVPKTDADIVSEGAIWTVSMGAAAPVVRVVAALRAGRRALARTIGRSGVEGAPIAAAHGITPLIRALATEEAVMLRWLGGLAAREGSAFDLGVEELLGLWFRLRLPRLWRQKVPEDVAWELSKAVAVLHVLASGRAPVARIKRMSVIALALAGRFADATRVYAEHAGQSTDVREAGEYVVVALWLRGATEAAREVLENLRDGPQDPPRVRFAHAVAAQLLDDVERTKRSLARLREIAPDYFADRAAADTRWAWLALILRRGGQAAAAEHFLAVARTAFPGSEEAFADVTGATRPIVEDWVAFGILDTTGGS